MPGPSETPTLIDLPSRWGDRKKIQVAQDTIYIYEKIYEGNKQEAIESPGWRHYPRKVFTIQMTAE